jgi:hypothetical protein
VAASRIWLENPCWTTLQETFSWKHPSVFIRTYAAGIQALQPASHH